MKKNRLKEIVAELQGASKMHLKQSKEIAAHIDDMGSPAKQTISDAVSVAGNLLKGVKGVAASMLSTTSAEAGQNIRSQADFKKKYPANEGVVNDGGELPNRKPTTKNK